MLVPVTRCMWFRGSLTGSVPLSRALTMTLFVSPVSFQTNVAKTCRSFPGIFSMIGALFRATIFQKSS